MQLCWAGCPGGFRGTAFYARFTRLIVSRARGAYASPRHLGEKNCTSTAPKLSKTSAVSTPHPWHLCHFEGTDRSFAMYVAFPHADSSAPSDCLQGLGAFGAGLPCLLSTLLDIPCRLSRVRHGGRNQDGVGGTCLVAPSTLCGSPVPGESTQVLLSHLLQHRSWMRQRPLRRQGGCELDWLTPKGRCVRGSLPRRAMRASGDSPCPLAAKRHLLATSLRLMASFRCMLLTLQSGLERFTPKAPWVPGYPMVLPHSPMSLSRRTQRRLL